MKTAPALDDLLTTDPAAFDVVTAGSGPQGRLPITADQLRDSPSGDIFGLTQNAGMGWDPRELGRPQFLILSTQGGIRAPDGRPIALGYHTGHWEIGLLMQAAAEELRALGCVPFAGFCSDPCDGRTQGTAAMMLALAGLRDLPSVLVPGGVTLPPIEGEDAGKVQSIGARFAHGELTLDKAAELGCRACGSPGGGCQFLGTAATSQVIGEALGLALVHSALSPSGQPIWT